ncbi:MAG: CBS domain-containing protein [Proteobacteria bacterium]|nr:CBS domain-containing protein [Pseudomonadota bacterium]
MKLFDLCSSELISVPRSATIIEAAILMREKHVGSIVVMGDSLPPRAVGIITDRDIVIKVVAFAKQQAILSVEQVMSKELVVSPGTFGVFEAMELMRDRGVRRLLVLNEAGEPRGVVSFDDLLLMVSKEVGTMAETVANGLLHEEKLVPP